MPLTVGGGIRTLEDIRQLLLAGCDKVSINSAAVQRSASSSAQAARRFGSQCIVVNIDPKRVQTRRPRSVGSPHQRRPHAARASRRSPGPSEVEATGRRRDRAHQHGRRRHQGRLRFGDHRGRERGGVDSGRGQRRGGQAGAPGRRDHDRQGRRGPGGQHFSLRRVHDSRNQADHGASGAFRCGLENRRQPTSERSRFGLESLTATSHRRRMRRSECSDGSKFTIEAVTKRTSTVSSPGIKSWRSTSSSAPA